MTEQAEAPLPPRLFAYRQFGRELATKKGVDNITLLLARAYGLRSTQLHHLVDGFFSHLEEVAADENPSLTDGQRTLQLYTAAGSTLAEAASRLEQVAQIGSVLDVPRRIPFFSSYAEVVVRRNRELPVSYEPVGEEAEEIKAATNEVFAVLQEEYDKIATEEDAA